jgi:pimeloyl-ACP methyl ester carboxylesterase
MGNTVSAFDVALATVAFEPPACSYPAHGRKTVRTVDGDDIAMQMCAPFSVVSREVPSTIEQYQPGKICVLYSHGNAEDMGQTRALTQNMADQLDCNFLTYDYVGYGRSSYGTPSEGNMNSAIEAVYQYAVYTLCIPERSIVLMGRSIGTAPTVYLASRVHCDVRGTILVSPLASGVRTLARPRAGMLQNMLDKLFCPSIQHVAFVHAPVCIVHGGRDSTVPVRNAEELHAAVPQRWRHAPLYVPGAGHNDIMTTYQGAVMHHIQQFLRVCEPAAVFEIYGDEEAR